MPGVAPGGAWSSQTCSGSMQAVVGGGGDRVAGRAARARRRGRPAASSYSPRSPAKIGHRRPRVAGPGNGPPSERLAVAVVVVAVPELPVRRVDAELAVDHRQRRDDAAVVGAHDAEAHELEEARVHDARAGRSSARRRRSCTSCPAFALPSTVSRRKYGSARERAVRASRVQRRDAALPARRRSRGSARPPRARRCAARSARRTRARRSRRRCSPASSPSAFSQRSCEAGPLREDALRGALDVLQVPASVRPSCHDEQDRVGDLVELQVRPVRRAVEVRVLREAAVGLLLARPQVVERAPGGRAVAGRELRRWRPGRGRATTRGGTGPSSRRSCPTPTPSTATRSARRGRSCPRARRAPSARRRRAARGRRRCAGARSAPR